MNQEFVVIYIINSKTQQVLYLRKNHGPKRLIGKLVEFGGLIEPIDKTDNEIGTIINAAKRELKEELHDVEKEIKKDFFQDESKYNYFKKINIPNGILHILKIEINEVLPQMIIPTEGNLEYQSIHYHNLNPKEFPENDIEMLNGLFEIKN